MPRKPNLNIGLMSQALYLEGATNAIASMPPPLVIALMPLKCSLPRRKCLGALSPFENELYRPNAVRFAFERVRAPIKTCNAHISTLLGVQGNFSYAKGTLWLIVNFYYRAFQGHQVNDHVARRQYLCCLREVSGLLMSNTHKPIGSGHIFYPGFFFFFSGTFRIICFIHC